MVQLSYLNDIEVTNLTITGGSNNYSWHLLGNPYTSALTWYTGWTTNNIAGTAQIWNESGQSYSAINSGEEIPISNGFMVQAENGTGSLTIPKASRTHGTQNFYKAPEFPVIKMAANNLDKPSFQQTQIRFNPNSTNNHDLEYDSDFLPGYAAQFYSIANDRNLAVNSLPNCEESKVIPLGFIKNEGTNFSIKLYESANMVMDVWIRDKMLSIEQNLSIQATYYFNAGANDEPDRFELYFYPVSINEPGSPSDDLHIWSLNGNIQILNNNNLIGEITVFNLIGHRLREYKVDGQKRQSLSCNLSPGVYIVVTSNNLSTKNFKIVVE